MADVNSFPEPKRDKEKLTTNIKIPQTVPDLRPMIGDVGRVSRLTALQEAGVSILKYVGFLGAGVIAIIFCVSFLGWNNQFSLPSPPQSPIPPTSNEPESIENYKNAIDQYQRSIDQYERLVNIQNQNKKVQEERAISLFQAFIITGLLPTFTSILGYIFGSQVANANNDDNVDSE